MYKLPDTLTEDISNFGSLAKEFEQGIIEPLKFKVTRVPMGIYEQRKDGVYMVRVRTTGGVIHPFQFINLIDIARRHKSGTERSREYSGRAERNRSKLERWRRKYGTQYSGIG